MKSMMHCLAVFAAVASFGLCAASAAPTCSAEAGAMCPVVKAPDASTNAVVRACCAKANGMCDSCKTKKAAAEKAAAEKAAAEKAAAEKAAAEKTPAPAAE